MKRYLVGLLLLGADAIADPAQEARAYFQTFISKQTPGCVVSVAIRGKTVFEDGFGVASFGADVPETLIDRDKRFRVASVTKPVIATGVLILRDKKLPEVDVLELTLGKIYPAELKLTPFAEITVRQLLDHTSGLVKEPAGVPPSAAEIAKTMAVEPAKWLNGSPPGTKYEYSNLAYMLLADIIERLSGMRLQEFMSQAIFRPLGMRSSLFADPLPLHQSGELVKGYMKEGEKFVHQKIDMLRRRLLGSGGLLTTAEDLGRFSRALEDKLLLTKDTWNEALTPSKPSVIAHEPYGLGWTLPSGGAKEHLGGGYGSYALLQVKPSGTCGFSTIILCNFDSGSITGFAIKTAALRLESLFCSAGSD